ncbi:hypothetical protein E9993_14620 [Labilibacter sediminis]|nr:hypothetical protein E9993_14620 [Labilibacter sediminis]
MKTTLTQFISYLEELASLHTDINHDPETHPTFIRFYEANDPAKAARNQIKHTPCIMVKDYDFHFEDNKSDNVHKVRDIEFLVIDKISQSSTKEDVYTIWERTEEIGDEFIMRMKDDKRNRRNNAVIHFDLNKVRGIPADITAGGLYATSYSIPVSSIRSNDPEPDKWTDL